MLDGTSAHVSDAELPEFLQMNWERIDRKSGMRPRSPKAAQIESLALLQTTQNSL
jgi:hypothetical protein